jgi:hypothetical protein
MKKIMFILIAAVVCMSFLSVSFARDMGERKGDKKWDKECQDSPMCHMNKMMMGEKKLVATQDGGAVLMMGNKLIKYDAQLNIIKEVEIKIDMEEMKKNCPMRSKMQDKK